MTIKNRILVIAIVLVGTVLVRGSSSVRAEPEPEQKTLVFVAYPDPAEFLMFDILRRVGDEYQKKHPNIRVKLEFGLTYLAARKMVLEDRAEAMAISEMLNEPRAYQAQHATGGAHASGRLKLNHFLPVATRLIRNETETLEKMRLGLATDEVSEELRNFVVFFSSAAARRAVSDLKHLELHAPSATPNEVTEIYYKREKKQLSKPLLIY